MVVRQKSKKLHIYFQGAVSIMLILTLLSVGSPHAEAISDLISGHPGGTGLTSAQANNTRDSCTTEALIVVADTRILLSQPTENYGEDDTITIDANSSSPHGGLFRWDLSGIPIDATIQSVSLTVNVTGASVHTFGLYNLKRAWTESGATWSTYDGTNSWGTHGAANTTTDRDDTNLWITDSNTFSTAMVVTIHMNTDGVNIVQDWVNGELQNHGLTIQNYNEPTPSRWTLTSKENLSPDKPKLNVTYCSPSITPTVTVTANAGQSKVYGEADPTFSYTASESIDFTGALGRAAGENVGTYSINQGNLAADGYEIVFVSADFTIIPRPIWVTADSLTKTLGSPDPALTYQITSGSLVNGDTFSGALVRDPGEDVGQYNINQGSLAINDGFGGNNYQLSFVPGTLTITDSQLPPVQPHVFHGEIRYVASDNQPIENDQVMAFVDGVDGPVGIGNIFYFDSQLVYQIDVLADDPNTSIKDGAVTGDTITFKINGRIVATDTWQGGATRTLHLHPPYASTGGPYVGLIDAPITLNGVAQDLGNDVLTTTWDLNGDGQYNNSSALNPSHTYTTPGARTVSLLVIDVQGGQGTDSTPVVIIKLEGLSQAYDGTAKSVTVTGVDEPYTYTVTYAGETQAPTNAGTYEVVVEVKEGTHIIGSVTRTMTITSNVITVTAHAKTKVYGEDDPELTYIWTGELVGDDSLSGELSRIEGESVDSYEITQGSLTAGNNYVINYTPAQLTITPRAITVQADDHIILLGDVDPPLTYEVTAGNLAFNDYFTGNLARQIGDTVGFYAIEQGSLGITGTHGDQNYTLTFFPGTLTITVIQQIPLVPGWNLVSFSLQPLSTAILDVLESIEGKYTIVYAWDGAQQPTKNWNKYDPNAPPYLPKLENIDQTQGFWIYMSSAATLSIQGTYEESTYINLSTNGGGWNLVGFPSSEGVALPGALEGKGFEAGSEYLVFAYIASDTADPWKVFDSTAPSYGNDLLTMTPGLGYWIYVNTDVIWEIIY